MRRIAFVLLALAAAACASTGHDFPRPSAEALPLGVTTRADIVAVYGKPDRQLVRVVSAPGDGSGSSAEGGPAMGALTSLFYTYEDKGAFGGGRQQKLLKFDFANDRLFAYSFLSNVLGDTSNFDEVKMARLANGVTTKDEVRELFGDPSGRAMFPALLPGDERYVYQFVDTAGGEKLVKRLELVFDEDDVLQDFNFVSDLGPAPRARDGSTAPPLFGPRRE